MLSVTSAGTKETDWNFKMTLYEQLGVTEYWLFDLKQLNVELVALWRPMLFEKMLAKVPNVEKDECDRL